MRMASLAGGLGVEHKGWQLMGGTWWCPPGEHKALQGWGAWLCVPLGLVVALGGSAPTQGT